MAASPATSTLDIVLNGLLDRYKAHVPDVDAILLAMAEEGMIDRAHPGSPAAFHWLAIDAMGLTARLVAAEIGLPLTAFPAAHDVVILDVPAWLRGASCHSDLPAGWEVTSDSIAATVARSRHAALLLAKSMAPPSVGGDLDLLAAADWVDRHFPVAARTLTTIGWTVPVGA
jgi:hypothetical protein